MGRILQVVCGRIIDGDRWIAERLKFLRERLTGDLSEDERRACEAEIETLSQERGLTVAGRRRFRILRRFGRQ